MNSDFFDLGETVRGIIRKTAERDLVSAVCFLVSVILSEELRDKRIAEKRDLDPFSPEDLEHFERGMKNKAFDILKHVPKMNQVTREQIDQSVSGYIRAFQNIGRRL